MNEPCKNPIAKGNSKYCSLHADDKKRVHINQMKTPISQKEAQTIVQNRKDKGRWMDASKKAKLVFTKPNKYWAKNPGKADVKAIDDGSQEAKQLSPSPERKPKQKKQKKEKKPKKAKAPTSVPKQPKKNRVKFSIKALKRRIIKYLNWKYAKKENRFISPNEGALLLLNPLESYSEVIPQTFVRYKLVPSLDQFTKITIGNKSLYFDVTFINCMNYLLRTGIQNVKIGYSEENLVVKVFHNFTFIFGSEESVPASVEKKLEKKQEAKPMDEKTILQNNLEKYGNLWEKYDKSRYYFSVETLMELLDLKVTRYNTGNISSATLEGEHISNTHAGQMIFALEQAKLYYDNSKGSFYYIRTKYDDRVKEIISKLKETV